MSYVKHCELDIGSKDANEILHLTTPQATDLEIGDSINEWTFRGSYGRRHGWTKNNNTVYLTNESLYSTDGTNVLKYKIAIDSDLKESVENFILDFSYLLVDIK